MESRVIGNFHARFGAGENLEIISKDYLSLKVSTLHLVVGVAHIKIGNSFIRSALSLPFTRGTRRGTKLYDGHGNDCSC